MPNTCRFSGLPLTLSLVDLGDTPLANSYLENSEEARLNEKSYPLHAKVCESSWLVQLDHDAPADAIFDHDYAYLSSYSKSWVAHAKAYADKMEKRFELGAESLVAEVASNDGYLLQHFVAKGIPVVGIEPAGHAASIAETKGVRSLVRFFGEESASEIANELGKADLIAANNVLAHVPDIRDFVAGFKAFLKPEGIATFEFPHLLNLIDKVQFDTIYHEHYSYLSLLAVEKIVKSVGLRAFDVEELSTHGGSIRVFVCHEDASYSDQEGLTSVRKKEADARLDSADAYRGYQRKVEHIKLKFNSFLEGAAAEGKSVAAYGAAAKGNTFLNFCGVTADQIKAVADLNPQKQNKLLPGTHIPIVSPDALKAMKPDYVIILPWNLRDEIAGQMAEIREHGGQFVVIDATQEEPISVF